jgi:hypothetical protein
MLDADKLREPYHRGLLYLPFEELVQPFFVNDEYGIPDGRCELAIRQLEMPLIDSLAPAMRYRIGIAMRYVAYSFDGQELTVAKAIEIYGHLAERIAKWMDQHSENLAEFNIDTLLDLYRSVRSDLRADYVSWFRERVHAYVNGRINGSPQKGRSPRAFDIEASCAELLACAPVLHVESHVYDQCEVGDWTALRTYSVPAPLFRVQVDGETWLQSVSDPFIRQQTEWLLFDLREPQWKCYERVHARSLKEAATGNFTYGAWLDAKTGGYGPIESQMYVPVNGTVETLTCSMREAGRMFHVLGSLMYLFAHSKVRIREVQGTNEAVLMLPKNASVNDLIYDVLKAS